MKASQGPGTGSGMPLVGAGQNPPTHSPNQNMHSGKFILLKSLWRSKQC